MKTINAIDLKNWLETHKDDLLLIDVREPHEHETGVIESAQLIPLNKLFYSCPEETKKKIICYCLAGGRSARACRQILEENPELEVYNLEGGISGWKKLNLPIVHID